MARPHFNAPVAQNGYRWWYLDAISDDNKSGLTIIGFVGSVFSPYYRRARGHGLGDPENHCAINVALYGDTKRWAMTERGKAHVERDALSLRVGPSLMRWDDDGLTIAINERCMPIPRSLIGTVRFLPDTLYNTPVGLDGNGHHFWQAVAPHGRVEVKFQTPGLSWSGSAYHDMNWGSEPLEDGFRHWTWSRTATTTGTEVLYDVTRMDGSQLCFGRQFAGGIVLERSVPPAHPLRKGIWGMQRIVHSEVKPQLRATLEDAPFYTRNHVRMTLGGNACEAYHESLSLDRFIHPVTQLMLPFRMPRRA